MSNKIFSKFFLLILISGVVGSNNVVIAKAVQKNPYDVLGIGCLPVGMWVTPPDRFRNDAEYKKMAESGINFVNGFCPNEDTDDDIKMALDLSEKNGLRYFVNRRIVHTAIHAHAQSMNAELPDEFITGLRKYADHPAFAGELLMDEPGKPLIPSVAAFTKSFEMNFPDKMWHVNLFPTYATGGIQTFSYEDYIDTWLKYTEPGYLSYDSYPLLKEGGIINDYYYNLDLVRAKTAERRIPFWTFIQTLSIAQTPGVPDKREPSEADIRWQVWSNLAFGAKGIQYFCYWSPGNGAELFSDALIDVNGKETTKYSYVKKLNADIQKTGKILLECDAAGVIQTAAKPFPLYAPEMKSFGPVLGVTGDDNITGCFKDKTGKYYVLISPLTPEKGADVTLQLDKKMKYVTLIKGDCTQKVKIKNNRIEQSIGMGEAVLIAF